MSLFPYAEFKSHMNDVLTRADKSHFGYGDSAGDGQLARHYNIPIIEDDYDHEFHYSCQPLVPMASDDPAGLVIYISTFSKIMFPSARIGFIAVNKALAQAIAEYLLLICHKGNVLMQSALARWMKSGEFERHLRRTTRKYQ